ncbi:MAG: hypothetical protein AB1394_15580, partial [Bacteroidota bacterium]
GNISPFHGGNLTRPAKILIAGLKQKFPLFISLRNIFSLYNFNAGYKLNKIFAKLIRACL